jgi:hypothetical protein
VNWGDSYRFKPGPAVAKMPPEGFVLAESSRSKNFDWQCRISGNETISSEQYLEPEHCHALRFFYH